MGTVEEIQLRLNPFVDRHLVDKHAVGNVFRRDHERDHVPHRRRRFVKSLFERQRR